jgi:nicotinamide-nucleotide amidase
MSIASSVRRVARLLQQTGKKVVFAESCTGGLISGSLTAVPGISQYHCGGMVVYRNETKTAFLGIPPRMIDNFDAVSTKIALEMASRVLARTPEADIALSVTGHLGPDAPRDKDGLVFVGIAARNTNHSSKPKITVHERRCRRSDSRTARQRWVVEQALELLATQLSDSGRSSHDK